MFKKNTFLFSMKKLFHFFSFFPSKEASRK